MKLESLAPSEDRYRLLFEKSLTGAYRTTLDGRILDCNVSFCRMFGYTSREEVIGHSVQVGYFDTSDRVGFIDRLQTEKSVTNFEQRLRRRDGSAVWVLNSATLTADENGSEPVVKGTIIDITELRNAEQEHRRLAAIVRCSDDAILSVTLDGVIETWNGGAERIFGYRADEAVGMSINALVPGDRSDEYLDILGRVRDGHQEVIETVRVSKNGAHIAIALSVSPITDATGNVIGAAAIARDITDRKEAVERLRKSEIQYRLLFDSNPIPMWVFDRSTLRFLAVNQAAIREYGFSEQEFLAMTVADIRPREDIPNLSKDVAKRMHGLQNPEVWKHRKRDGAIIDVEIVCHDLDFQGIDAMLVAAHDITERKQAQEAALQAEEKYRAIFDNAVIGIFQSTPEGRPISINPALAQMHGYASPEELLAEVSNVANQLFADPNRMIELSQEASVHGVVRAAEVEVYRKDRSRKWVRVNLRAVRDAAGNIVRYEGTVEDITDRKAAEKQVQFLASYDALTGLPNRTLFKDRLEDVLAGARRRNKKVALLFLDLDRFKTINDSLGHSFGDQMLKNAAERLKESVREQDTVARVGGDEFLILLSGVKNVDEIRSAARRVQEAMARIFVVQGRSLSTSCSIGISVFPEHGGNAETLMKNADAAMYSVKDDGGNSFGFYSEEMNGKAVEQLALENDLRMALERNEFFLVYQPQVEIASGRITGMEALIRWRHPELGLVPPDEFIPIAENNRLILPIGEWVLRSACSQVWRWRTDGLCAVPVAVNVSAVQFRHEGFSALVRRVLRETGLPPQYLELELTESLLLSNADVMFSVVQELREMGVMLAIDDFGTGYSSLSYLKDFRVNKLKIDRSFIRDIATDSDDAAITAAIISMAKNLNLKVIAEGVEDEAQMSFLREHRCDQIQGYYFSKPISASEMTEKLECVHARE